MMGRVSRRTGAAVVSLLTAACGGSGDSSASAEPTVVDSAGVTIVTSHAPLWGEEDRWEVSAFPLVTIGELDGPEDVQLFDVRGARMLSDGRIVIANAGSHEVRFYSAGGEHLLSTGGEGDGPGEYRAIRSIDVTAEDSIFVWDQRLLRISVLAPSGRFARSFQLAASSERVFPVFDRTLADGEILVFGGTISSEVPDDGISHGEGLLLRYSAEGAPGDTLAAVLTRGSLIRRLGGPQDGFSVDTVPFDPGPAWTGAPGGIFLATGPEFEVRHLGVTGALLHILRIDGHAAPVTLELWESAVERLVDGYSDASWAADTREAFLEAESPVFVPPVTALLVGDGHLFARRYPMPGEDVAEWRVLDSSGVWMGTIAMPEGLLVWQIGRDFVLGKLTDDLGVERVVVYELFRDGVAPI
jgi:hypothetical protein